jgi:p-methyltransferase
MAWTFTMNRPKVIIIAMNQPFDNGAQIRRRMMTAERRAERRLSRFAGLNLHAIQKGVHQNLREIFLTLEGRQMDLLDLMNFLKNGRRVPNLTRENVSRYYSLANTVTLNGIYLYQYLRDAGYDPIVIQNYATANLDGMLQERPLAVCISSNFIYMDTIKEMAAEIKRYDPRLPVIAGGMLVKKVLDPGEAFSPQANQFFSTFQGKVDAFVVEAQGEQTLIKLLYRLRNGDELSKVPNLALINGNGQIQFTPRQKEDLHMDGAAIAWDSIPKEYLRHTLPLNTSRGCFYRCRFCTYHWFFPEVHYRSLEVLTRELRLLRNLGFVRHIRFTDDNFTANKARLKAVLEMMINEKFDFTWSSFARASALSPELVALMKASGCEFVDMGIESGSQEILDNMDKRLSRKQTLEAIRLLNDQGIYGRGSFIIGYPGETERTFGETIDLINESGLPYYHPYLFYYSRNTLVHKSRVQFGLDGLGLAWKHQTMDAVEASRLMSKMIQKVETGYTDGVTYVEEIYKLLRGEGYSPEEIRLLFRLKRELHLATKKHGTSEPWHPAVKKVFRSLEAIIN